MPVPEFSSLESWSLPLLFFGFGFVRPAGSAFSSL